MSEDHQKQKERRIMPVNDGPTEKKGGEVIFEKWADEEPTTKDKESGWLVDEYGHRYLSFKVAGKERNQG